MAFFVEFSGKLHEDVVDLKRNPYIPGFCPETIGNLLIILI